jgi:DNA end-binding protein Ku
MERDPEAAAEPVDRSRIVKGYEYSKGRYITLEPEELAHLRVPSKHTMEITQFVESSELSPELFEKPYFAVPEDDAQTEAFLTVRKALLDTKRIALSKIAFAGREHVVAIAPAGDDQHGGMMVYTMRYASELRNPAEYFGAVKHATIDADSLSLAKELIQRKSAKFDPAKFVDGYETAVRELVEAKLKHAPIPRDEAPAPSKGKVVNLADALRRSIRGGASKSPEESPKAAARRGPTLVKSTPKPVAKATKAPARRRSA